MATYSKLLLSTGGGIISQIQQAEQVENTATLLIGLGGTGIDCLTEVKKAVRERLQPDNPQAFVPKYDHIRFLAVDTDMTTSGIPTRFDSSEIFDISNPNIKQALKSKTGIQNRAELEWLDPDKIDVTDISGAGAGGLRQAGRYMLMDKSSQFLSRIEELIRQAKTDLNAPSLYVHVFAGIGGGTGSGTFLDACYLIKKAIANANNGHGVVLGYFFLPDVNLAKVKHELVRKYIPKNGYAAMQELDYCMRLPMNGGSFTQTYKNGIKVEWNEAPVQMCHLISATSQNGSIVKNAYNNAMKVTAEYVMDFLTKMDEGTHAEDNETGIVEGEKSEAETKFTIESHLSNFLSMVLEADAMKTYGYHLRYLVIGASCASIPMRKINTYLAGKVFEEFAGMEHHVPTENDVQQIAERVRITKIESILSDLTKNGGGSDLAAIPGHLNWEFTRNNGDQELVDYYTKQKAEKIGIVEKNAKSMVSEQNKDSVIARICRELDECAKDLNRGPAYAYKVVQASFAGNLLNIIDGMIKNAEERKAHISYNVYDQPESAKKLYEESRDIWRAEQNRKLSGKPKKAYAQYVADLERYVRGQIEVEQLKQVLTVLREVKAQVSKKADEYYLKFDRVMENLISTFQENQKSLADSSDEEETGTFAMPLLTIKEIRPTLDAEVKKMDMPGLLAQFVNYMFAVGEDGAPVWIAEDENKITKAVKDFFINTAFSGYANRSITKFLYDKYGTDNMQEVTTKLYDDFFLRLKDRSEALFPVDHQVYDSVNSEIAYVSVPASAQVVIDAAQKLHDRYNHFSIKKSALKDRIYMMRCAVALPLSAYANSELYENEYYGDIQIGRHYYIGKGGNELFNDWHQMLPLRPQGLLPDPLVDESMKLRAMELIQKARDIYEAAKMAGLLSENEIMRISDVSLRQLDETMEEIKVAESRAESMPQNAAVIYTEAAEKMEKVLNTVEYVAAGYRLPTGNMDDEDSIERIRKDYFVSSPALHTIVRRDLEKLQEYREKCAELKEKATTGNKAIQELKDYCKALFTGVLTWDQLFSVTYPKVEYGMSMPEALTDFNQTEKFKYAMLPLYQAFLTYQKLDTEAKKIILAEANQRYSSMAAKPDVVQCIKMYEAKINGDFVNGFLAAAATFPEINEEAKKFMGTMMQELNATVQIVKSFGLY